MYSLLSQKTENDLWKELIFFSKFTLQELNIASALVHGYQQLLYFYEEKF